MYLILGMVSIGISAIIILSKADEFLGTFDDVLNFGKQRSFRGRVVKKFIHKEEHMDKTLVLEQRKNGISAKTNEVFPFDHSGFYDYVELGDSLVKKEGDLFATVYREGAKDTVIYFKFKNYETGEVFPKEWLTIILEWNN